VRHQKAGKETTENFVFETIAASALYQFWVFFALKSCAEEQALAGVSEFGRGFKPGCRRRSSSAPGG